MEHHDMNRPVILAVSFGTSFAQTREKTIGAIERALAAAFPDCEIRRAFTSPTIIRKLRSRDGILVDDLHQALERLEEEGVRRVLVQPTHMMPGFEYDDLKKEAERFIGHFERLLLGGPLLETDGDCLRLARILGEKTMEHEAPDTAVIWMGHGSAHPGNAIYGRMQQAFGSLGYARQLVGTVEGEPTLSDMIAGAKAMGVSRVILRPMMIVAGDHATNDMAGEEPDSWKNQFLQAGFRVECILEGIGQYPEVHEMICAHASRLVQNLLEP